LDPGGDILVRRDMAGIGGFDAFINGGEVPGLDRDVVGYGLFDDPDFVRSSAAAMAAT